MNNIQSSKESSSFRDPNGYIFYYKGEPYRYVSMEYAEVYQQFIDTGLYNNLVLNSLIIPHEEVDEPKINTARCYKILKPEVVDFISYPYEWCFSQYKDAALAMLKIQKIALDHNMSLKDSSAFNIQFVNGKFVLIDTLSFQIFEDGKPWVAYRQFCKHFLAPLTLMSLVDVRLGQLMSNYIDGIPLDLVKKLLPISSNLKFGIFIHINLHSLMQKKHANSTKEKTKTLKIFGKHAFYGLIESLEKSISQLTLKSNEQNWENYYTDLQLDKDYRELKIEMVKQYLDIAKPKKLWDLGANTGLYSRIAVDKGISAISFDSDYNCVEKNYLLIKERKEKNHLSLYNDITNPSSALGWANKERKSLTERGPVELILALAFIHHLAISNNLPFEKVASFLSSLCTWLIIEFVPKSDPMVMKLLSSREDIFPNYSCEEFESVFCNYFSIEQKYLLKPSSRIIYLFQRK